MVKRFSFGLVLALAAVISAACEKVPLLAPSESNITVTTTADAVPTGGSATIVAFVIEQAGTPVQNGTSVTFTATLGTVSPASVETRDGRAQTTFTAGTVSGTAQIRATSGGATGTDSSNLVEVLVGSAAVSSLSVGASSSRVPSGGGTVTISASASDASGNRLVGVPITFTTTAGALSANTATTDANGEARVTLTTSAAATVTASVGSQTATVTVALGTAGTVGLSVTPAAPRAGSPVTLTITPAGGTAPRVLINWGDGSTQDLGTVAAARTATHSYASSGAYTIVATSTFDGESFTNDVSVTVASGGELTLSAPSPVPATVGTPISVTVTPAAGAAPRVTINWGDGSSQDLGVVTGPRAVSHNYSAAGTYVIVATGTAGNDTFTSSTTATISPQAALTMSVTPSDSTPARCAPVTFTASVTPSGTSVGSYRWEIDSNVDGEDETVTNNSTTLTRAFQNAGTKTISVTATATDGRAASGQTQIVVETLPAVCP